MNDSTFVAVLSLIGTLIGSLGGILTANKLINYRLCALEKKMEKHNMVIERVYHLEKNEEILRGRLDDLSRFIDKTV